MTSRVLEGSRVLAGNFHDGTKEESISSTGGGAQTGEGGNGIRRWESSCAQTESGAGKSAIKGANMPSRESDAGGRLFGRFP